MRSLSFFKDHWKENPKNLPSFKRKKNQEWHHKFLKNQKMLLADSEIEMLANCLLFIEL